MLYPYKTADQVPEELGDAEEYMSENPYNTYNTKGLPPGAICSPSAKALVAAIVPEDTAYLYFCHSAEGVSYYAETFYEHQSNLSEAGLDQ